MKLIFVAAYFVLLSFTSADKLTGRWETKPSGNGNVTGVVFKEDGSFMAYVNKKPFVSGNYTVADSIFTFTDNGCMGMPGVYKLIFFSNSDSLRFEVVNDDCTDRREGMLRTVLGKVNEE